MRGSEGSKAETGEEEPHLSELKCGEDKSVWLKAAVVLSILYQLQRSFVGCCEILYWALVLFKIGGKLK